MKTLLVIEDDYQDYAHLMSQHAPDWQVLAGSNAEMLKKEASRCKIWLGLPNQMATLLRAGVTPPRWIQSTFAGITPLLADDLPKDYLLSRAVGVFGQQMAEYVLTYMLAHERQVLSRFMAQHIPYWLPDHTGSLYNKQVLIVGAGTIGVSVANFLKPFGVKLTGIATTRASIEPFEQIGTLANLQNLATQADYIINLLPDTPLTHNIFNTALLSQFKSTAVFINAGRGASIVDQDLMQALQNKHLALAVLDVFRTEPLPSDHPFWNTPNLLITEHTAAEGCPALIFKLFTDNLKRFEQQQQLAGQVDFNRGY